MRMMILIMIAFFQAQLASASVVQGHFMRQMTLKYGFVIEPEIKQSAEKILGPALGLVQAVIKDRILLSAATTPDDHFDFIIQITDRKRALAQDQGNELLKTFTKNIKGDAFSIFLSDQPASPVIVRVLWDEAMLQETDSQFRGRSKERPDAFARLVTLLGHEIIGNVKNFLSRRAFYESPAFRYSEKVRADEYLRSEVRAFTAGVWFLETLIAQFDGQLPAKLIQDFRHALDREKQLFETHRSRLKVEGNVTSIDFKQVRSCKKALQIE